MKIDVPAMHGLTNPAKLRPMPGEEFPEPDPWMVEQLAKFGQPPAVCVTADGFILSGLDRAAAARGLGWADVHSLIYLKLLEQLTEDEILAIKDGAFRLMDHDPVWRARLAVHSN